MLRSFFRSLALGLVACGFAFAQETIVVTRQALAEIVQRIDARVAAGALVAGTDQETPLAATNARFDAATLQFFGLRLVEARRELLALEADLEGPGAKSAKPIIAEPVAPASPSADQLRGAALRESLLRKISTVTASSGPALRALKSRLKLRWEDPSPERSAEFLIDPFAYEVELAREVEALVAGRDPFLGRRGDHWRTFRHGRRDLALRAYLPEDAPATKMPLVIAFHGAGGDENFFFELADDGLVKRLADEHGCLVVTPLTPDFLFSKKPFESLLAELKLSYDYDEARVFVLGHSMGAMATSKVAGWCTERLAGACCVAGYEPGATFELPVQVISGTLDRIVSFQRVRTSAEKAALAGHNVTFLPLEDQGHTLLLGPALRIAFQTWFSR